jgi:uncharacterized protein (TIGR03435 family)
MAVEALFWFHPLVWWLGARLVEERERACDEEVLRLGSEPQAYAESILKVCEFYLESPLVCVAGITGSNLKRRIEEIMLHRIARKLELGKKLLLAAVGTAVLAAPVAIGLLHPAASQAQSSAAPAKPAVFEDVSIKLKEAPEPGKPVSVRFQIRNGGVEIANFTVKNLIEFAYRLNDSQIVGGPAWINSGLYQIEAKVSGPADDYNDYRPALQKLLADRFKLTFHRELKQLPAFDLVVGKNGSRLKQASAGDVDRSSFLVQPVGHLEATAVKMAGLVHFLENRTGRMVVDKTGLTGRYDFALNVAGLKVGPSGSPDDNPALIQAVSEQLGLDLVAKTGLGETLVIDHVEQATEEK